MYVNVEQNQRHFKRKAARIPEIEAAIIAEFGRPPADAELAARLGVAIDDVPALRQALKEGYGEGGFKVYDVSKKAHPKEIAYQKTHGFGVHRFDADERYAYMSTEMEGYLGNILVVYDVADPGRPQEVSRWWMPGQHIAGGEKPTWKGYTHRLHHAMRCGDELWAAVWHAGIRVIDARDISNMRTVGAYNYHPPIPEPTHTVMPFEQPIAGRRIAAAIDEEHEHRHGALHGFLWLFDVTDLSDLRPISAFDVSEMDSPWSRTPGARFGAHQFNERLDDTLIYATWFAGGLRIIDVRNPEEPEEVGHFIPEPVGNAPAPQSNDVCVDDNGLIYVIDRLRGLDILEFDRP
jgi:hypothetical protein